MSDQTKGYKEAYLITGVRYAEVKNRPDGTIKVVTTGLNTYAGFYDTREEALSAVKEQTDNLRTKAYNYVTIRHGERKTYDDNGLITTDILRWNDINRAYEEMSLPPGFLQGQKRIGVTAISG